MENGTGATEHLSNTMENDLKSKILMLESQLKEYDKIKSDQNQMLNEFQMKIPFLLEENTKLQNELNQSKEAAANLRKHISSLEDQASSMGTLDNLKQMHEHQQ